MGSSLLKGGIPLEYTSIAVELIVGYFALLILTKVLGKTQITQISAFDFISALILGELVGNSLYDDKISVFQVLTAILIWGALIFVTEFFTQKSRKFRHLMEGTPDIVINKGIINYNVLKKNHLDLNQLQHLLRAKDIFSVKECEYALLESNGTLSVIKKPLYDQVQRQDLSLPLKKATLPLSLIMDGEILYDNLKIAGEDDQWLQAEINRHGFTSSEDVLFAEWTENEPLFVQGYE
ncbi:membrane protein [Rossellomorea marisflavi]|uniref:Membrane protein n=1 Tax=Rossellomorea marisflavi TaxID=189381 RepID=A0A0M0GRD4_9BACI|nr:membrane protein [Rossellomorea marisflavi]